MLSCIHVTFFTQDTSLLRPRLHPILPRNMGPRILKRLTPFVLIVCIFISQEVLGEGASPLVDLVSVALSQYAENIVSKRLDSVAATTEDNPETRGGYGHGHGGGGNGYGAITLDPVSIISLLALGAFLINNILQLLRANQPATPAGGGRSFESSQIPEAIFSSLPDNYIHKNFEGRLDGEPNFSKFFENVGSLYYLQPKKRNTCIKKVVCGYVNAQKSREDHGPGNFKTSIFDFMLSTITRFVVPELTAKSSMKEDVCKKFNKLCSDSLLQDAKVSVKNKVYNEVSTIISALTMKQLVG